MAVATLTGNMAASTIPVIERRASGVVNVVSKYSLTATLTTGDIIQFMKLPAHAKVTSMRLVSNVNLFADAGIVCVGTRTDPDKFIKSVTPSLGLVFHINNTDGLGWTEDERSDGDATRYTMVELVVTTAVTGSKSGVIMLAVDYMSDQAAA